MGLKMKMVQEYTHTFLTFNKGYMEIDSLTTYLRYDVRNSIAYFDWFLFAFSCENGGDDHNQIRRIMVEDATTRQFRKHKFSTSNSFNQYYKNPTVIPFLHQISNLL